MLIFEKSRPGRGCDLLPASDVEIYLPEEKDKREQPLHLPELSEGELSRHYTELAKKSHGVNDGFYPLGSCTMKYNPKINEDMASAWIYRNPSITAGTYRTGVFGCHRRD